MTNTTSNEAAGAAVAENPAVSDEQLVRETWEFLHVYTRDLDSYGTDQFNILIYSAKPDYPGASGYLARFQENEGREGRTKAWANAAAFTRDRKEEARRV